MLKKQSQIIAQTQASQDYSTVQRSLKLETLYNMASSIEVGKELECSVCLENFQTPKLLSCMHTFCEGCIEKLIENQAITCPECRDITQVIFQ